MGSDKALLRVGDQPVIQLLADRLCELTDQVFLSTDNPGQYDFLNLIPIGDKYPCRGPLAGLHAALLNTTRTRVLLLACDLPGVSSALLRRMVDFSDDYDVVIPVTSDRRLQPVCAVYGRNCLSLVEKYLNAGESRVVRLAEDPRLRVRRLTPPEGCFTDSQLLDVNSPEDFAEFLRLINS